MVHGEFGGADHGERLRKKRLMEALRGIQFAIDLGMNQAGIGYGLLLAANSAGAVLGGIILESTHWLKPTVRVAMISTLIWAAWPF